LSSYVVDTSVLAEYLDEDSPFSDLVEKFFRNVRGGKWRGYITHMTIAELVFVAYRIYREGNIVNPNEEAKRFIAWLTSAAGFRVVDVDFDDAILAGELRKRLRIAITDRFVIAVARRLNAVPLFLRIEREMEDILDILREYNVKFLEEIV